MYLRSIYLRNFRIYEEAFFEFDASINKICGLNAKGKTTLLEAIYLLISGRSFRNASMAELIRHGAHDFHLQACFVKHGIEQILKITFDGRERRILYNNTVLPSSACLLGVLKGGVLSPDDAALIKGPPALRRQFLDMQIAQSDPLYVHHLTRFHRAMRQRNCLLKARNGAGLASWEEEMATSAAYVCKKRDSAAELLKNHCASLYFKLTGDEAPLSITYKLSSSRLLESFAKNRKREMELGFTLAGPHKDDLQIMIGGQETRFFSSEGQQRITAAVLRLAEWEHVRSYSEEKPLMLMDDVGISLDEERKEKLLNYTSQLGQVMLTSTVPHLLEGRLITIY
jgi:DNA replication and repair protein RecF